MVATLVFRQNNFGRPDVLMTDPSHTLSRRPFSPNPKIKISPKFVDSEGGMALVFAQQDKVGLRHLPKKWGTP